MPTKPTRPDVLGLLGVVAATLWMVAPLLAPSRLFSAVIGPDTYRSHDWLEVAKLDHFARHALLHFGRLPEWNPLLAGGLPQLGHPSDGTLGPLFLSSLLLGEVAGMKINVVLVALSGALGVYGLLRGALRSTALTATLGAVLFAWSGWLPARVAVGFYESALMAALPAVLALWLWPGAGRRHAAAAAALLGALAIQLQLALPVFVLWMLLLALASDNRRRLLATGLGILGLAAALGAARYLPMLALLREAGFRAWSSYPTHPDSWYHDLAQLAYALLHSVPQGAVHDRFGHPLVQEYATLQPGLAALALAPLALTRRARRAALPWAVVTGVFLWLAFGPNAPLDLFRPLHALPLFGSMRGPLRYLNFPVITGLAVLAALGFAALTSGASPRHRAALAGLTLLVTLPSARDARQHYAVAFSRPLPTVGAEEPTASEGLLRWSRGGADALNLRKYINVRRGVPTIYRAEDIALPVAATPSRWLDREGRWSDEPTWRGEAWLLRPGAAAQSRGHVEVAAWEPGAVRLRHDLANPAVIVVNQNSAAGWSCGDRELVEELVPGGASPLAFRAPAGEDLETTCRYRQPGLRSGAALSLLALLVLGWLATGRPGQPTGYAPASRLGDP